MQNFNCKLDEQYHNSQFKKAKKYTINEEMKEHDYKSLHETITEEVRKANLKVLSCQEDETRMPIGQERVWKAAGRC